MRTFSVRAWIPTGWPCEASPNGNRQRHAVVAAPSVAAALRAYDAVGLHGITRHHFNLFGGETWNRQALAVTADQPGVVFYDVSDGHDRYQLAPTKEKS